MSATRRSDQSKVHVEVADAVLEDVDGGTFTPTYDRSKPRKGTHLYDNGE